MQYGKGTIAAWYTQGSCFIGAQRRIKHRASRSSGRKILRSKIHSIRTDKVVANDVVLRELPANLVQVFTILEAQRGSGAGKSRANDLKERSDAQIVLHHFLSSGSENDR